MRVSVERECGESVDQASALAGRTLARLRYAQVAGNLGDLSFQHVQAGVRRPRAAAARSSGVSTRLITASATTAPAGSASRGRAGIGVGQAQRSGVDGDLAIGDGRDVGQADVQRG